MSTEKQVIGQAEEKHVYEISISSRMYEGKETWSIYKGRTLMNSLFDVRPTTKDEAVACAKRLLGNNTQVVTHFAE